MKGFARACGYIFLFSGLFMMVSPEKTRRWMQVREEFTRLSPSGLRMLGGVYVLMGGMLVAVTRPSVSEVRMREAIPPELRKAA